MRFQCTVEMATLLLLPVFWSVVAWTLASHPVKETSETNSAYSIVPCDMRPLSGWMDNQGNLWGVGTSDLWWYNLTAGAWAYATLPSNASSDTSSWRVTCGHSGDYLVLMGRKETYLFRVNTLEWKKIIHRGPTGNRTALWCHNDSLLLMDLSQSALYRLNPDRGKWTKKAKTPEILKMFSFITHETFKHTVTWYGANDSLFLFLETPTNTSKGSLGSLWSTSLYNVSWFQVAFEAEDGDAWPDLHSEAVTWVADDVLWLWKLGVEMEEVWQFEISTHQWQQVLLKQTGMEDHGNGPSLTKRLAAWTHQDQLCVLTTRGTCASEYVPGTTWCLHMVTSSPPVNVTQVMNLTTEVLQSASMLQKDNVTSYQIHDVDLFLEAENISSDHMHEPSSVQLVKASWLPKVKTMSAGYSSLDKDHVSLSANMASWPQAHSSVFGSIIFFGTSLTIFAVVGVIWCIQRCVHFPKEALLLRDPPSVRYTAIPDTIA